MAADQALQALARAAAADLGVGRCTIMESASTGSVLSSMRILMRSPSRVPTW